MTMTKKKILCLDFDGVIHSYTSGWKGVAIVPDPPVHGAGAFILAAMQDFTVAVYSSRSKSLCGRTAMRRYIEEIILTAYYEHPKLFWETWERLGLAEMISTPWTHGDDREIVRDLCRRICWPWFKPSAFLTIDDRALMFTGEWPVIQAIKEFTPWNKRPISA